MEGDSVKYNIHSSMGEASLVDVCLEPGGWRRRRLHSAQYSEPWSWPPCLQSSAAAEALIISLASIQEAGAGPGPRLRRISSYSFHRGHRKRCHQEDDRGSAEVRGLPQPPRPCSWLLCRAGPLVPSHSAPLSSTSNISLHISSRPWPAPRQPHKSVRQLVSGWSLVRGRENGNPIKITYWIFLLGSAGREEAAGGGEESMWATKEIEKILVFVRSWAGERDNNT